jgi:hypothetical protein
MFCVCVEDVGATSPSARACSAKVTGSALRWLRNESTSWARSARLSTPGVVVVIVRVPPDESRPPVLPPLCAAGAEGIEPGAAVLMIVRRTRSPLVPHGV